MSPAGARQSSRKEVAGNRVIPGARQFVADRSEDRLRVAPFQSREEQERFPIRAQVEEIFRRDLTGHDGVCDARGVETRNQFALTGRRASNGLVDRCRQAIVGLVGEGRGNDLFYPASAGGIGKKTWINAVTGDDAQCFRNFHEARIMM